MKKRRIWMAVVNNKDAIVFAKGCLSQRKAESAIVEYLRKNKEFHGNSFSEACFWIGENNLRLDLQVFEMEAKDFVGIQFQSELLIKPPPKELGLYRVVYVIDVGAGNVVEAARNAYQMMSDSDSMPPVLEVIDGEGNKIRIDLSERKERSWKSSSK